MGTCACLRIDVPELHLSLVPGSKIRLSRFDTELWLLSHGWFVFSGNRAICGWYLTSMEDSNKIRPLQLTDLNDIYMVE